MAKAKTIAKAKMGLPDEFSFRNRGLEVQWVACGNEVEVAKIMGLKTIRLFLAAYLKYSTDFNNFPHNSRLLHMTFATASHERKAKEEIFCH